MINFIVGIKNEEEFNKAIDSLNKQTQYWTYRAARGECDWICADCSCHFPGGMPDSCIHGHQNCTDIIIRDKSI